MFTTALVATDLSTASDQVIGCLHGLRPLGTERIILSHALGIRYLEDIKYQLAPLAEPKLREQQRILEEQGFQVETVIAPGIPSWEINRLAKEKQVSMIVVGSHGETLAKDVLLGSVTLEVMHSAEVPVFVAQLKIMDEAERRCEMICGDFREHLLFPTDFSDVAERAFSYVEQIVRSGCKHVTLLHVQDKSRIYGQLQNKLEEFNRIDGERLQRMKHRLKELGALDVTMEIPYGFPKQQIAEVAEQGDYTLIVMGTQGRGYFGELFVGSVAHHVARRTIVPTLLIPPLR